MSVDLTAPQRRVLTSYLRHIEGELALVERMLASPYEGILIAYVDDVDDATREQLGQGIHKARALIREARERFALEPEQVPTSRWAAAHFGVQSVTAEECESRRLAGYGRIPSVLAAGLDPLARRLSALLLGMQSLAVSTPIAGGRHAD